MSSSRDHAPTTSAATPKSAAPEAELSVWAAAQALADELDWMASDRQAWADHPEIGGKKPLFNSHLRGKRYGYSHAAQLIRSRLAISEWRHISTAPKTAVGDAAELLILGFAPDEEGYAPTSREGFWNPHLECWVSTLDPTFQRGPQPTHWMPLPAPPQSNGEGC